MVLWRLSPNYDSLRPLYGVRLPSFKLVMKNSAEHEIPGDVHSPPQPSGFVEKLNQWEMALKLWLRFSTSNMWTRQTRDGENRMDSTDPRSTEPCRLYRTVKYRTVQTLQTREVQNRVDSTTREAENLLDSKTQRIREPCGLLEERNFTV